MNRYIHHIVALVLLALLTQTYTGCRPTPQPVKHLNQKQEVDSVTMAQLQLNTHLAEMADKECQKVIQEDSINTYAMDDFGFWYTKTLISHESELQEAQEITLHILINSFDSTLISDSKITTHLGANNLPIAITRSLKMMRIGEQMRIIAPWYTAYGVEGTNIIKPYSNLLITLTVEQ